MAETDACSDTGSTKKSSAAVDTATAWGLTTPANRTPNPTTAMDVTAAAGCVEHTVPTAMKRAPASQRTRKERARIRRGPPKSTNNSSDTEPNTANSGVWLLWVPYRARANTAGTRTAARTERLVARSPGS